MFQCTAHTPFVFRIYKGGGFIEYDDGSIFEYRSCKGDPLLLSAGEHISCKSRRCIVTIRERQDQVVALRFLRSGNDLLIRGITPSYTDIFHDRLIEQKHLLRHIGDACIQLFKRCVADICIANADMSFTDIIVMHKEFCQRAFSAAAVTDKCSCFSLFRLEGNAPDDLIVPIGEAHISNVML